MDKKEVILWVLCGAIVIGLLFWFVVASFGVVVGRGDGHICEKEVLAARGCCYACDKFGYEYLHESSATRTWGVEAVDDCFCKDGDETKQIY